MSEEAMRKGGRGRETESRCIFIIVCGIFTTLLPLSSSPPPPSSSSLVDIIARWILLLRLVTSGHGCT